MTKGGDPAVQSGSQAESRILSWLTRYGPGIIVATTVALASKYLEQVTAFPALMMALVVGLLLSSVVGTGNSVAGLDFSGKHLLALGVALLGARLTLDDVTALGLNTALVVVAAIIVTLTVSWLAAKALGLSKHTAVLAGAGTAICGASAIVAVSSVLSKKKDSESEISLVVITVVVISAIAMILYPLGVKWLGLSEIEAGVVLGGSIHNVPQAVGAGYTVSEVAGNTATLTKLFRVALLGPLVIAVALLLGARESRKGPGVGLPWFIIVFAALILIGSFFKIPELLKHSANFVSTWLLLIAISAIGLRTPLAAVRTVGPKVLVLVLINSAALVAFLTVAALLRLF